MNYSPADVAENLSKLRVELQKLEPSRFVAEGRQMLEYVGQHVSNLIAAASNGTPPGAPELWTLSIAVDYLCDHHIKFLTAEIREQMKLEAPVSPK